MKGLLLILCAALPAPLVAQTATPAAQPATPPPACTDANHQQFDFWVGKWDVRPNGKQVVVAHSLIEKLYDGCAIRENWMPLAGHGGGSLNSFDVKTGKWRQAWVDSSGTRVDFTGVYEGDAMVLTGDWANVIGPGKDGIVRMTYSRQPGGAVRQLGEVSSDGGKTWGPSFDLIYSPSA